MLYPLKALANIMIMVRKERLMCDKEWHVWIHIVSVFIFNVLLEIREEWLVSVLTNCNSVIILDMFEVEAEKECNLSSQ